ncbi:MAG TPA: hypothetical protein VGM28_05580, partial [Candidatus Limnocylindrales bacterium]
FAQRRADLVAACEAEGRDPDSIGITAGLTLDAAGPSTRPGAAEALPPDVDAVARALDAWRDLGIRHVQVDLRPVDERTIDILAAARAKHLGAG